MNENYLVSFLPYLDVDVEAVSAKGRIRNMPSRNGRGSNEETYAVREDAIERARLLADAGLIERAEVYERDTRYVLQRKLIWDWKEPCPEGGDHDFTPDVEYDATGQTVNCSKCGEAKS